MRLWNDWPEVVGSHFMGLMGLVFIGTSIKMYYKKDGDHRPHKMEYTVIRHDDPRASLYQKMYDKLDGVQEEECEEDDEN